MSVLRVFTSRKRLLTSGIQIILGVAAVEMPHDTSHVEASWTISSRVIDVGAEQDVEAVADEVAHGPGEETCADEEDE